MKRIILFFFVIAVSDTYGQNEFGAAAFFRDFKNIYADSQAGFLSYKGDQRKSEFEEIITEYKVKLLLPLADSGKIVVPVSGNPYVIYYFEPDKVRLKVDQRAANLRDAVLTAFGKPLYTRTETSIINNYPFTNSLYFTEPNESRSAYAAFRLNIYYSSGKYNISFEIRGKNQ